MAVIRQTQTKTFEAADAAALDAAYLAWKNTMGEAEQVSITGFASSTGLVLIIQYVGGSS